MDVFQCALHMLKGFLLSVQWYRNLIMKRFCIQWQFNANVFVFRKHLKKNADEQRTALTAYVYTFVYLFRRIGTDEDRLCIHRGCIVLIIL